MKRLVYILSKHGTVKNYVEEVIVEQAPDGDLSVNMNFTIDRHKAVNLEELADDFYGQLASQMSPELVGIEEVAE